MLQPTCTESCSAGPYLNLALPTGCAAAYLECNYAQAQALGLASIEAFYDFTFLDQSEVGREEVAGRGAVGQAGARGTEAAGWSVPPRDPIPVSGLDTRPLWGNFVCSTLHSGILSCNRRRGCITTWTAGRMCSQPTHRTGAGVEKGYWGCRGHTPRLQRSA